MSKEAVNHLTKADKKLAKLIKQVGDMSLQVNRGRSPYEALVESVIYQQLSGKAAASILKKFKSLFPKKRFPKPEDIVKADIPFLRSAGLSNAKALAIKDIAQKTLDGVVPSSKTIQKMEDATIIEQLTVIRGVGQWTVEMLLIFRLGRTDVLPVTDYGVRKGFALTFGHKELPTPKDLAKYGERWKPYRTAAAWYLWRSLELKKDKSPR